MDRVWLPLLLSLVLVACGRDASPAASQADADRLPDPAVGAPAPQDGVPLPERFIVSTNEPFWQARVEDGEVVVDGPDVQGRRFSIPAGGEVEGAGARTLHGSDGDGTIVVMVLPGPCEDTMSGAVFPFAGELTIDGIGPHPGCARPADMPLPPGSGL